MIGVAAASQVIISPSRYAVGADRQYPWP